MKDTKNEFQKIIHKMRNHLPGSLATGIFSIKDGMMLSLDSSIPDSNMEIMSVSHALLWDRIAGFLKLLPSDIVGDMKSITLEVEGLSFYILVDNQHEIAIMAVSDTGSTNLGLLRIMANSYLKKAALILGNI